MSKIDEFSRLLGSIEKAIEGLTEKVDGNRDLADKRHEENTENLERISGKLDTLSMDVAQDRAVAAQLSAAATLDRAQVAEALKDHDKRLKIWEQFHGKVGAILAIGVPFVTAFVWLLWSGIVWIASFLDFKALFGRIFH